MRRRLRNALMAAVIGLLPLLLVVPAQVVLPDPWDPPCNQSCLACHFPAQVGCP